VIDTGCDEATAMQDGKLAIKVIVVGDFPVIEQERAPPKKHGQILVEFASDSANARTAA
jgi:hypothetical protein